jgi:1-phosphofructokinase
MKAPEQTLAVDTSGPALTAMVNVPCAVAKPNLEELQTLFDSPLATMGDVIEAATELQRGGWASVLVSLGPHGALVVGADGVHHGRSTVDAVRNTVGAGDALLAGYLAGLQRAGDQKTALAEALAWAHAAVTSPGTGAPAVNEQNRATVELSSTITPQLSVEEDV